MSGHLGWQRARRILAVRLDHFGDVLMTTPALAAIRANRPDAHLALWCSPASAAVAEATGLVDEVVPFKAPWMKHEQPDTLRWGVDQIAQRGFDAAVIFTTCTQSALPAAMACMLAEVPLRLAHAREQSYSLLTNWVPDPDLIGPGMRHEVQRQLDLVATLGWTPHHDRLRFEIDDQRENHALNLLRACGLPEGLPYVVMHPGATAPSRRYPAERFGAVADGLWRERGVRTVFTGADGDQDVVQRARAAMKTLSIDLSGRLDISELGGVIAHARLLVSNNTGPAHLAAALATPVVDLYALTNPQHTPWKSPARVLSHDVPCRNCLKSVCPQGHNACLTGITTEQVLAACLEMLPT